MSGNPFGLEVVGASGGSAPVINIAPRKDLYGRRMVREGKDGSRTYAIVVDSHFESEEGGSHPRTWVIVAEEEKTHLPLVWIIPCYTALTDWDSGTRHDAVYRFVSADASAEDLSIVGGR